MKKISTPFLCLALLWLAAACAPARDLSQAPQGDQSILIWHRASAERVDVTTRTGGRYNPAAFDQIDHIFRDRHTGEEYPIDPKLIDAIADLRDKLLMSPSDPIELLSGYRSPESNGNLSKSNRYVAKNSYHMKGKAADIRIPEMSSSALEAVAKTMQKGGVALYPDGGPDFGHVHIDTGPVRGWSVVHGKEAGLRIAPRSNNRSPQVAPQKNIRNLARSAVQQPPVSSRVKVKPLNSYDDLPEPTIVHKALPPVAPHPSTKADVKTKTGKPVMTKSPAKTSPLKTSPANVTQPQPVAKTKNLEQAKKQWVKTPYHKPAPTPAKPHKKPIKKEE